MNNEQALRSLLSGKLRQSEPLTKTTFRNRHLKIIIRSKDLKHAAKNTRKKLLSVLCTLSNFYYFYPIIYFKKKAMHKAKLNPNISIDTVLFGYNHHQLKVLLVERNIALPGYDKKVEDLKLPGGLVYNDELLEEAAGRVLQDLTGIAGIKLTQFDVLDSLERMSDVDRVWLEQTTGLTIDRVVSVAFYGITALKKIPTPGPKGKWIEPDEVEHLPFDHKDIIERALLTVRRSLIRDALIFDILPEKFTINDLQTLTEVFYGKKSDSRNFRKKIKKMDFIVALEEKQRNVAHKPARLFKFDKRKFKQFSNHRLTF